MFWSNKKNATADAGAPHLAPAEQENPFERAESAEAPMKNDAFMEK
jgi:hypothetical protein